MAPAPSALTVIGDIGLDFVLGPLELWPERGTELIIDRHEMRPGFSAANAALAARHLGASCTLVGDVGDDPLGYWLVGELAGIDVRIAHLPASTTTTVAVLHDDAERSFMTTRGHLELVTWSAMSARIPRAAPGAIALMTGVFLMPQIEHDYPLILADLNARGYRVAVDTGWPPSGWTVELRQAASQWMQHCDILLLNETEVLHLAAKENLEEALRELAAMLAPGGIAVAKTGSKGASACSGGRICDAKAVRLNVIDTIGAGDSFNAGFLLALGAGAGAELTEALKTACRTASTIISKFPRQSIPPAGLAQILGTKRS